MPNILDDIRTCQYDGTIATGDTLGQVRDGSSPDADRVLVDVTPVDEGTPSRKVHTAVSVISGTTTQQGITVNESSPVVQVAQEASAGAEVTIYGALETINTATQRCGVRTSGTVIFRKTLATGIADGATTDLGKSVLGPTENGTNSDFNHGSVSVDAREFVYNVVFTSGSERADSRTARSGIGTILGFVGPYLLVQLNS